MQRRLSSCEVDGYVLVQCKITRSSVPSTSTAASISASVLIPVLRMMGRPVARFARVGPAAVAVADPHVDAL